MIKIPSSDIKIEQIDNQMSQIQKEFKLKTERAKQFVLEYKNFKDIEQNPNITHFTSDLSFPEFEQDANYAKEFWEIYLKNQIILKVIKQLNQQTSHLKTYVSEIQTLQDSYLRLSRSKNRKKNRRLATQIEKKHTCPYTQCQKIYGSDVSLNLHVKLKHNGGNKTDRQKLAQQICQAQFDGKPMPQINLQFPPGYLKAFRQYYLKNRRAPADQDS